MEFSDPLDWSPLWMFVYLVVSSWAIDYHFCWRILIAPTDNQVHWGATTDSNLALGISLLVISVLFKFNWVGAWVQALIVTWFCDKHWTPPSTCRNIMQVEGTNWDDVEWCPSKGWWIPYTEGKASLA